MILMTVLYLHHSEGCHVACSAAGPGCGGGEEAPLFIPRLCSAPALLRAGHSAGMRRNVGRYTAHRVSFSLSSFLYGEVLNHCEQLNNFCLESIFYRYHRVKKSSISTPTNSVLIPCNCCSLVRPPGHTGWCHS